MADNPFAQFAPQAPAEQPNPFVQFAPPAAAPAAPRPAAAVQAEYDAKPWYAKAGQAADDIVRLIANGATFGYADKLAGTMNGTGADAERAKSQEAQDRAGLAGTAAQIGGSMAVPVGTGATLVGRFGTGAMQGVGGLAARMGLGAVEGAGYGALDAAGHDQPLSDGAINGAIFGAAAQPIAQAATGLIGNVAGAFSRQPHIPSADELRQAGNAAYDAAENAGVMFTPKMVDRLRQNVTGDLANFGYDPALQPGAAAVLRRLDDLAEQNVSLKGLDQLRKVASNGYQVGNRSNNSIVNQVIDALDTAVANPQAGELLTGNGPAGVAALEEARGLWARLAKSRTVENAVDRAELRAASTGSGGNVDNATRQNLRRIAENPRGFTPDETAALDTAVRGTPAQNLLRGVGKLAPTGVVSGGIGAATGASLGSMFGPGGSAVGAFAVPAVGQAAKWTADAMTADRVRQLQDIIRAGGTRAAAVAPPNAVQRVLDGNRDELARIIMLSGIGGQ